MEKVIYVVIAVLVAAALGVSYTLISQDKIEQNTYLPDYSEYDQRIAQTLGSKPTEDVRYLLNRPALPKYNYPFEPAKEIEYLIYLKDGKDLSNHKVVKAYKELKEEINQWFYVYGSRGDYWLIASEDINATVFYDQLVVGIMLVDYKGNPRQAEVFNKINEAAERLAAQFGLTVEYQETVDKAVSRSLELSSFFKEYDQWIILVLRAEENEFFKGQELHDAITGFGFKWGEFNNYHWINPDEYVGYKYLLTVGNYDHDGNFIPEDMVKEDYKTSGIVVGYYLPTCAAPVEVFDNAVTVTEYLQNRLGGSIQNLQGQYLDDGDFQLIRTVVGEMAEEMEEYGIKPGHDRALWLFDY